MDACDLDKRFGSKAVIIKASQRSGARALSDHLMNDRDNDHVSVLQLRGFMADDLHGAFDEAHAISKATRCKQFLFSVSLNPPQGHDVPEQDFEDAADLIEAKLDLTGQPRAIILHEKEGRRHAHVVWSRINPETIKAINLPHFKVKLRDIARDLYLDHGWTLPKGLATYGDKNPLNFTLSEWQQAKRVKIDPREIKQIFQEAWERSDNLDSYRNALAERGYHIAKGDRRGHVALDVQGNVYAIAKWTGIKAKDVVTKLGDPSACSSVTEVGRTLKARMTDQVKAYIAQVKQSHADALKPLLAERKTLVTSQRSERQMLKTKQEKRWIAESTIRSDRLNKGLRGLFDRLTGKAKPVRDLNVKEALGAMRRDQEQRDRLVVQQLKERQNLQARARVLKFKHAKDRKILANDIAAYMRRTIQSQTQDASVKTRRKNRGFDLSR